MESGSQETACSAIPLQRLSFRSGTGSRSGKDTEYDLRLHTQIIILTIRDRAAAMRSRLYFVAGRREQRESVKLGDRSG